MTGFELLEDIPKLGEEKEEEPKKTRAYKKRKPFVPKDKLPLWEQPLLSLTDKYKAALSEIARLQKVVAGE